MRRRVTSPLLVLAVAWAACSDPPDEPPPPKRQVTVTIAADKSVAEVSETFLSFAVDAAQVVGGVFWDPAGGSSVSGSKKVPPYDFSRQRLRRLARELSPAVLRIGGTAADEVYYDLSAAPAKTAPQGYRWVLTRGMVDGFGGFAKELGLRLLLTLNAGHGPRDAGGAWTPDNARSLIQYVQSKGYPVDVWELGNEINGYLLLLKLTLDAKAYAADLKEARKLLAAEAPKAKLAGPSCAYWPKVGDFIGFYDKLMPLGGAELDVVTWHYYPQQSRRCVVQSRRATATTMLQPENLDEMATWAKQVEGPAAQHAKAAQIWLGETGGAQCGGEPGVSDAWAGVFWWLDELGQVARRGHQVVIRQTLSGSNYGLIDEATLKPNPDYWASLLFKRLMGRRVLRVEQSDKGGSADEKVRIYAHCAASGGGAVTALAINLDQQEAVRVNFAKITGAAGRYALTADGLGARTVELNGVELRAGADGAPPALAPSTEGSGDREVFVDLPATSVAFVVLHGAGAAACK